MKRNDINNGVYDLVLPGGPNAIDDGNSIIYINPSAPNPVPYSPSHPFPGSSRNTLQLGQGGPFKAQGTGYDLKIEGPIRDLILVTPSLEPYVIYTDGGFSLATKEISAFVKRIMLFFRGNAADVAFYTAILRSAISPPDSSPA